MQPTFKFNAEDEVKCRITGFKGTVVARTEWNNGCKRYTLQPVATKDGKLSDSAVFDEHDLVLVKAAKPPKQSSTGGPPRRDPTQEMRSVRR